MSRSLWSPVFGKEVPSSLFPGKQNLLIEWRIRSSHRAAALFQHESFRLFLGDKWVKSFGNKVLLASKATTLWLVNSERPLVKRIWGTWHNFFLVLNTVLRALVSVWINIVRKKSYEDRLSSGNLFKSLKSKPKDFRSSDFSLFWHDAYKKFFFYWSLKTITATVSSIKSPISG